MSLATFAFNDFRQVLNGFADDILEHSRLQKVDQKSAKYYQRALISCSSSDRLINIGQPVYQQRCPALLIVVVDGPGFAVAQ